MLSVVLSSIKASPNTTSTPQVMKPRVIQPYEYTCNSLPLPARLTLLTNIIGEHLQRLCNNKAEIQFRIDDKKVKVWTITSRFLAYRRHLWLTPAVDKKPYTTRVFPTRNRTYDDGYVSLEIAMQYSRHIGLPHLWHWEDIFQEKKGKDLVCSWSCGGETA